MWGALFMVLVFWVGWGPEAVADFRWWCLRGRYRRAGRLASRTEG